MEQAWEAFSLGFLFVFSIISYAWENGKSYLTYGLFAAAVLFIATVLKKQRHG